MSYYSSSFGIDFNEVLSSAPVNFTDQEIVELALKILDKLAGSDSESQDRISKSVKTKEVCQRLVFELFGFNGCENENLEYYSRSEQLRELFSSSSKILQMTDFESKKRSVYARLRMASNDKEIERYARYENIPRDFAFLSKERDCIKYLTHFFLKRYLKTNFNARDWNSCKKIVVDLRKNLNLLTPYQRVAELQQYLHSLSRVHSKSEFDIPSKLMRVILSTARLHFIIRDDNELNVNDLAKIHRKQAEAAGNEEIAGYSNFYRTFNVPSVMNKKYIRNWRKRHLMPFLLLSNSDEFYYISTLDEKDPFVNVKLALLDGGVLSVEKLRCFQFTET